MLNSKIHNQFVLNKARNHVCPVNHHDKTMLKRAVDGRTKFHHLLAAQIVLARTRILYGICFVPDLGARMVDLKRLS